MRSQVRIRSGANNSLGPSDLGEALNLTVVHLWETCLPRPCAPPGLVRPSGLDTRDKLSLSMQKYHLPLLLQTSIRNLLPNYCEVKYPSECMVRGE
uniref:Uncharacterized protein n=1 Tax=Salix viminalis TaxID=40686 RepID=A0A6N2MD65_SALVM